MPPDSHRMIAMWANALLCEMYDCGMPFPNEACMLAFALEDAGEPVADRVLEYAKWGRRIVEPEDA